MRARLPEHLRERTRILSTHEEPSSTGRTVLWWVHHAMRVEENPALDVAEWVSASLDLPLRAVAVIGGPHPHDNDRHQRFALEGLRDLQAAMRERGQDVVVLRRGRGEPSPLRRLAADAAVVVTEDLPAPPWPRWLASFASWSPAPLLAVDAACVVPMSLSRRAPDRAFAFRDALAEERRRRTLMPWSMLSGDRRAPVASAPPVEGSIDLATADLAGLVASLDLDHSVAPVPDTPGGLVAAQSRWEAFRARRLARYARDRNDAALDGTSRMSAYLHYGMISPFRVAREAHAAGAEKFVEELLIWRELAHHWCRHVADPEAWSAIPAWARATLDAHRRDPRDRLDDEALARARTGEALWDLAQQSLLRHGELHNNLRMTWGKALLEWSASPEEAMRRLIELNHRFALDGCDPSSYGGLLWCLGLFDRPFDPERPVLGRVRPRPIEDHASRLDLEGYRRRIDRATRRGHGGGGLRVAVVGAGVAGLSAARVLADHGVEVTVFDKGRGPGGRISTRRTPEAWFDHGASALEATTPRLRRLVESWRDRGVLAAWTPRTLVVGADGSESRPAWTAWCGVGGMSRLARHLADGLAVRTATRITSLAREASRWRLADESGGTHEGFDAVLLALPVPQAAELLRSAPPDDEVARLASIVEGRAMRPAWVAMTRLRTGMELPFDRLLLEADESIASVIDQGSKPGSDSPRGRDLVLEATTAWTEAHLELPAEEVATRLGMALERVLRARGVAASIESVVAHRWRFAAPRMTLDPRVEAWSTPLAIGAAGDWCGEGTIASASAAGEGLAGRVLGESRFFVAAPAEQSGEAERGLFDLAP